MEQECSKLGVDTTFLIDVLRNKPKARQKVNQLLRDKIILITTTINAFEILQGALISQKKNQNYKKALEFLELFTILDYDIKAAIKSSVIMSELRQNGTIIDIRDVFIAATLLANECTCVLTRNTKHFNKINELIVKTY